MSNPNILRDESMYRGIDRSTSVGDLARMGEYWAGKNVAQLEAEGGPYGSMSVGFAVLDLMKFQAMHDRQKAQNTARGLLLEIYAEERLGPVGRPLNHELKSAVFQFIVTNDIFPQDADSESDLNILKSEWQRSISTIGDPLERVSDRLSYHIITKDPMDVEVWQGNTRVMHDRMLDPLGDSEVISTFEDISMLDRIAYRAEKLGYHDLAEEILGYAQGFFEPREDGKMAVQILERQKDILDFWNLIRRIGGMSVGDAYVELTLAAYKNEIEESYRRLANVAMGEVRDDMWVPPMEELMGFAYRDREEDERSMERAGLTPPSVSIFLTSSGDVRYTPSLEMVGDFYQACGRYAIVLEQACSYYRKSENPERQLEIWKQIPGSFDSQQAFSSVLAYALKRHDQAHLARLDDAFALRHPGEWAEEELEFSYKNTLQFFYDNPDMQIMPIVEHMIESYMYRLLPKFLKLASDHPNHVYGEKHLGRKLLKAQWGNMEAEEMVQLINVLIELKEGEVHE